ncbi:MAG: CubicO group peptidase (beta-lactamase class C family) [Luteibaculaceae bacterium]|jgi:CubicO group peptidase (beta-lactamase class C family)
MKKALLIFIGTILVLVFGLISTGHGYLLKGIQHTYLKGKTSPGIYDLAIFQKDTLLASSSPRSYTKSLSSLLPADKDTLEAGQTVAFLIIEGDSIIVEEYFGKHTATTVSNSFSMAKSIVSLLIYMEMERDASFGVNQSVDQLLDFNNPGFQDVSVEDLLTMSAPVKWIESGKNPFSHNARAYYGDDLEKIILNLEKSDDPYAFEYKSGNSQILSLILEKKRQEKITDIVHQQLWEPLGMSNNAYWSTDEKGTAKAFCCFYATAQDFAKFGSLLLDSGRVDTNQIIAKKSLQEMLSVGINHGRDTACYTHHWWTEQYEGETVHYMRGIKGQYVLVLPEKNRVIVRLGHHRKAKNDRLHPMDLYDYLEISKHY